MSSATQALELAFRRWSAGLVAAVARRVGLGRLDLAEDAVQFAMLQAARTWGFHGIPEQPRAWLLRVALNRLTDLLRQRAPEVPEGPEAEEEEAGPPEAPTRFAAELPDDALRLLFACCHPALSREMQVTLTLKVACGFSVREVAAALLADEPTVAQRLVRAKRTLRACRATLEVPSPESLPERLGAVHAALYLLFNEGYEASEGHDLSRAELCLEALRLSEVLLAHAGTATPEGHALAALFCFRAANLPGRVDARGAFVPQEARAGTEPSPLLLARGLWHLRASMGTVLTPLHLEAEIALVHAKTSTPGPEDSARLLRLYDALLALKPSPIVALSRVVALARVRGPAEALEALGPLRSEAVLRRYPYRFAVEGMLLEQAGARGRAADCFRQAAALARTPPQREYLLSRARACE
ncbi:RNA polymerase sigma factor [Corallococcus coralloides]|uniref:RNA polymerase sigma factor n=1 Tax=Corallococcus coralloides TaxID=184914 RepID=UPI0038516A69